MDKEALRKPIEYTEWVQEGSEFNPVDRQIPVVPVFDKDKASLPHDQRVEKLRETRIVYATPFLKEMFDIPLEEVRAETLELASTIYEISSREWEVKHFSKLREVERQRYEEEKKAIREGKRGAKARNKKVEIVSRQYQQKDSKLESRLDCATILKETTIDDFIKSTFLTTGGTDSFLLSAQDLDEQSYIGKESVTELLKQSQERLQTMSDTEAIKALRYKDLAGNLITAQEAKPLEQVMSAAFKEDGSLEIKQELKNTARGIVDFYWRNARVISDPSDETPSIGLIFDGLLGSVSSEDLEVLFNSIKYFGGRIDSDIVKLKSEYERLGQLHYQEHYQLINEINKDKEGVGFSGSLIEYVMSIRTRPQQVDKWDPRKRRAVSMGMYVDRSMAFNSFSLISKALGGKEYHVVLNSGRHRSQEDQSMIEEYADLFSAFDIQMALLYQPEVIRMNAELAYKGLGRDNYIRGLRTMMASVNQPWSPPSQLVDKESREKFINKGSEEWGIGAKRRGLISMFFESGLGSTEQVISTARDNRALIERVKNTNLWFVAEQGDQFSVSKNPELADHSIKSITFIPQADYQGHRVVISTDLQDIHGHPLDFNFILTREAQIIWARNELTEIPNWVDLPFKNFLLKRLHFITSGALGQRGGHEKGDEWNDTEVEVRRSHWRILTSKNGRVYTLNSPQAKAHAEYVKETYGIDIYEENLRRKQAGTLGKDQVLTFVKAVKGKAEPNQLIYDESKLENLQIVA